MSEARTTRITVGGREFPCRLTMGAFRRYERETGKSAQSIRMDSVDEVSTLLWAAVMSACCADGVERPMGADGKPMTAEEFADHVSMDDLTAWANSMAETTAEDPKKKGENL